MKADLQDGFLVAGFLCVVGGVAAIYWPAAVILAGVLFFAFVLMIERAKGKRGPTN